ncbi:maleylpyruvate isomerase family mycothiol-dependent enzyme [Puerhibacterium puerhi]|uniref:maleylpyruvate isomerase family mycothiol-dependent enzyme n=1 Tax=Puerhibacterium puerhi TaxID=2692623 RepID=UPI001F34C058|nr:maleylpyruvate isomerase family mycothiol-dependent enzyme [Puerhibacterium puerhi]
MSTETRTTALRESAATFDRLVEVVRALPDAAHAEASPLPGWTRGHVLAHVDGVGAALARQAEAAARGEQVEVYDGGAAGRAAAIEAGARRTTAQHVAALEALRERLRAAWPAPGDPLWHAPVTYRLGTLEGALLAWWREAVIHAGDATAGLGAALGPATWSAPFCAHLDAFLAVRLPAGWRVTDLRGDARDVASWLAGRVPSGTVWAERDGAHVPLPELGPWPSSSPAPGAAVTPPAGV